MAPFELLYGRSCRSPIGWYETSDVKPLGTDFVRKDQEKIKFIQSKLLATQSRHNEYVDHKSTDTSFRVGDQVLLNMSPMKGILRFVKKDKISPWYISLFDNLRDVGLVAYILVLSPSF